MKNILKTKKLKNLTKSQKFELALFILINLYLCFVEAKITYPVCTFFKYFLLSIIYWQGKDILPFICQTLDKFLTSFKFCTITILISVILDCLAYFFVKPHIPGALSSKADGITLAYITFLIIVKTVKFFYTVISKANKSVKKALLLILYIIFLPVIVLVFIMSIFGLCVSIFQ